MVKVIQQSSQDWRNEKADQTREVLGKMQSKSKEEMTSRLASKLGMAYIDLQIFPVDQNALVHINEADARKHRLVLFEKTTRTTRIAMSDPADTQAQEFIREISKKNGWEPTIYLCSEDSLEAAWEAYATTPLLESFNLWRVALEGEELKKFEENFGELLKLKDAAKFPISQTIEIILAGANKFRTSDIHIEPNEEAVRIRYRVDGLLQEVGSLPKNVYQLMISRVKMLSHMKINLRDQAQDGHFSITLGEKKIDLRVNIIPGKYGENINIRLLSNDDAVVSIEELGIRGTAGEEIKKQIQKPNGMILNTGPTGSGKTTTLYGILHSLNHPDVKIITIEDPIEYSLPGIVQTEVSKDKSYTFGTALRAVVRQDPDIILVGEIRDEETADVAINAALTGHLVLSTLHTNSAPAAIPRFIELGVKRELITASINVLISQRLVRKLCEKCKEAYEPAQQTIETIKQLVSIISPKANISLPTDFSTLWKPVGCPSCNFSGYYGRVGIFEAFTMTPRLIETIDNMGTEADITRAALEDGMVTMTQDGIIKAVEGTTTLDEVWRVTDQSEMLHALYEKLMSSSLSNATMLTKETLANAKEHISSIDELSKYAQSLEHKDLLQFILASALLLKAGDIHLEPTKDSIAVRFRLDGILKHMTSLPLTLYPSILGEIKLWSKLESGQQAGVADGRFSITVGEAFDAVQPGNIDFRLSIILGGYGETVVMRILNQSSVSLDLSTLDIRKENLDRILSAMKKPHGLILNTGPTGSGKTTTLYSILAKLNTPEVKIITVEDPIEYRMEGVLQTQVDEKSDYTFPLALRALLRQNPDILMIGEIRDEETASIAVQAAGTGHLVLSTLHTNSAAGTTSRLLALGVSADDLANAGNAIISQRLVRKLCPHCKKESTPSEEEATLIKNVLDTLPKTFDLASIDRTKIWTPVGCKECNGVGYAGRMVIAEVLLIDKAMQELIGRQALSSDIETLAKESGMLTIVQDGILSVLEGKTSLSEIERVTEE